MSEQTALLRILDSLLANDRWEKTDLEIREAEGFSEDVRRRLKALHDRLQSQKQSDKIQEQKLLLEGLVDALPVAVFVKDIEDDFRMFMWNKEAESVFRIASSQILGKTDFDLFPKEQAEFFRKRDLETCNSMAIVEIPEESVSGPNGTTYVRTRKSVLSSENGKRHFLIGISENITKQKEDSRIIEEQQANLHYSSRMASLGEMAGGIAHEINNPVGIIQGKASQLLKLLKAGTWTSEKGKEQLEKIVSETDRIAKIIRGLRTFSRNADNDPFSSVSIRSIFEDVLGLCSERFRIEGIRLELQDIPDLSIHCRPAQVAQVLSNLLNNGFDAVSNLSERWVRVEVHHSTERLRIFVTDSGKGIPSSIVDKLMQPFFTTKEVGKGTGLGLSISKGIIEDHSGHLSIDKDCPNTRFVIDLPLRQDILEKKAA